MLMDIRELASALNPEEQPLGADPSPLLLFDLSSRTRKRQELAGEFYIGPGLREIARYGGYATYQPPGNTDPWVRESLKLFSRNGYDSIWGFTRRGEGIDGMYKSLYKYDEDVNRFHNLSATQRQAMVSAITRAREKFRLP